MSRRKSTPRVYQTTAFFPWYFSVVGKIWFPAVFVILAVAGVAVFPKGSESRIVFEERPVNFAHRGASASAPENTFAAFDRAAASGADALELDVRPTSDGRAVVIHDETVDRTTDGDGEVGEMTLADLRSLGLPTLEEVLRRYPGAFVNVEIKGREPDAAEGVLSSVRDARAEGRVLVVSEDHGVIERFRELSEGRVATGASGGEVLVFYVMSKLRMAWMLDPAYEALQIPTEHKGFSLATPRFFAAAENRGVEVDVWTVNDPGEMRRLLDFGASGIMTDHPETLAGILANRSAAEK